MWKNLYETMQEAKNSPPTEREKEYVFDEETILYFTEIEEEEVLLHGKGIAFHGSGSILWLGVGQRLPCRELPLQSHDSELECGVR